MFNLFRKKPIIAILGKYPKKLEAVAKEVTENKYAWKYLSKELPAQQKNIALVIEFIAEDQYVFPNNTAEYTIFKAQDFFTFADTEYSKLILKLLLSLKLRDLDYFFEKLHELRSFYTQNNKLLDFQTTKATLLLFDQSPHLADNEKDEQDIKDEINIFYTEAIKKQAKTIQKQVLQWQMAKFNQQWSEEQDLKYKEILDSLLSSINKNTQPYEHSFISFKIIKENLKSIEKTNKISLFKQQIKEISTIKNEINKEKHSLFYIDVLYELGNAYKDLVERNFSVLTIDKAIETYSELMPLLDKNNNYDYWLHSRNGFANVVYMKANLEDDYEMAAKAVKLYASIKKEFSPEKEDWDYAMFQQNFATATMIFAELLEKEETSLRLIPLILEHFNNAIQIWTAERDPEHYAIVLENIGRTQALMAKTKQDPVCYQKAITTTKKALAINTNKLSVEARSNNRKIADYNYALAELTKKEEYYRESIVYYKIVQEALTDKNTHTNAVIRFFLFRSFMKIANVSRTEKDCLETLAAVKNYTEIQALDSNINRVYFVKIKELELLSMLCSISEDAKWKLEYNKLYNGLKNFQFEEATESQIEEYKEWVQDVNNEHQ